MTLVVWSGGADSTLVLYDAAQVASPTKPVRAISFEVSQIAQNKEQARARKKILTKLRKDGMHIEASTVILDTDEAFGADGNPQAVIWLLAQQALVQDEDLYMGFIYKDDWWTNHRVWHDVFSHLQYVAGRTGTLVNPLATLPKESVIWRLKQAGLLGLVWWCAGEDLPGGKLRSKPCGECPSCKDHLTASWRLENFGSPLCGPVKP